MKLHRSLSRKYARQLQCQDTDCFYNAWLVVGEVSKSYYVEGYATAMDRKLSSPIHHAWVEQGSRIIDPTPIWSAKTGTVYFPGIRFICQDDIWEAAMKAGATGEFVPVPLAEYLGYDVPELAAARKFAQDWQARQWGYDTYEAWMKASLAVLPSKLNSRHDFALRRRSLRGANQSWGLSVFQSWPAGPASAPP